MKSFIKSLIRRIMPEQIKAPDMFFQNNGLSIRTGERLSEACGDKRYWLSFTQLIDEQGGSYLYIASGKSEGNTGYKSSFLTIKSIMLEKNFFADRHLEFMNAAMARLPMHRLLKLSDSQKNEFEAIVEKIERIGECEYRFKKEYLQQLVFLFVHFSIKNFGTSATLRSPSGKYSLVSKQLLERYAYSLN